MNKILSLLGSFRTKVTVAFVALVIIVISINNFIIYKLSVDAQISQLRENLMVVAQTAALMIDGDMISQIPLDRSGIDTVQYKTIAINLRKIKAANSSIKYIYTMKKTDDKWIWRFIVDPDPSESGSSTNRATAYPGDPYDARRCPEIMKALNLPSADKIFTSDEWGYFLSAYAPIRNSRGDVVAALGVDMLAGDVSALKSEIYKRTILILILGIVISILLGLIISGRITRPVKNLVEGTRHIAAQDLDYKVEVSGNDEMAQMGKAFNGMAHSLFEYRAKLHDYFYRVVQSLVRMLEAKDKYTSGHSERVAGYASDIGRAMGLSEERINLLKKAAEIHDIGKLAINENVLNKKGGLTDEEWHIIREHPAIGGEILKPALLDEEVMSVVRSHHERYDGTGYPDRLGGDKINLLAQIISVADAYDAMTSLRPYRNAMAKDEALDELKRGAGTQFNTEVVRKFVEIMK